MVAIGDNIEASVLTVLALAESGVTDIWAKAITRNHGRILERVGATTVVYPEFSMGEQVARMLAGGMLDYLELDDDNCIARTVAPEALWDKPLAESEPDRRYGSPSSASRSPERRLHPLTPRPWCASATT